MKDVDKCDACIASGRAGVLICQDCQKTSRRFIEKARNQDEEAGGENE